MPNQTCKNITAMYIKVIEYPLTVLNIESINNHQQYFIKPEGLVT